MKVLSLIAFVWSLSEFAAGVVLEDISQLDILTYDYVIVGAGTAGLALANRLTEDTSATVLVLEAGISDERVIPVMAPFLGPSVTPNTPFDWNYTVTPQAGLNSRTYPYPRGRLLGGSSSANYMIHQYGTNDDWNRMANVSGDAGWSWNNMKKYIKRHEKFVPPIDGHNTTGQFIPSLHSFTGELQISLPVFNQSIDARVIATTSQLAEFPYNEDISGINNDMLGIGWAQSSMTGGARASASTSYLNSSNERPNLTVMLNALVVKLIPTSSSDGVKSFRTIEFVSSQNSSATQSLRVQAFKEVILSAGAVGTPLILQRSGIGAADDLVPLNITVLINSPHVGHNLQDHPLLPNIFTVAGDESLDDVLRNASDVGAALSQWETNRTGFISNNVVNNIGFARLNNTVLKEIGDPSAGPTTPHFEMIFANFWLDPVVTSPSSGSFLTILTALVTPTSRGSVKITSSDPFTDPLIDPNMLATQFDITTMRESVKAIKRLAAAPAWLDYVTGPFGTLAGTSDEEVDAHVRAQTSTVFHPSSSASMTKSGNTPADGVVNPDLTVKGASGLRIVDLSVFPFIPSCHPQGPVYMLAERAADLIKGIA